MVVDPDDYEVAKLYFEFGQTRSLPRGLMGTSRRKIIDVDEFGMEHRRLNTVIFRLKTCLIIPFWQLVV